MSYRYLIIFLLSNLSIFSHAALATTATNTMNIEVSVMGTCVTVTATTLSFVNYTPSAQNNAQATITVTCLLGTNYTVALNAGSTTGGTISQRLLTDGSGHTLKYNIYTNSNYTTIWGDGTSGSSVVNGAGGALPQSFTAYGSMPAGQTLPSTSTQYTDTVTITVNYT